MPDNTCRMHEGVIQQVKTLERERKEDRERMERMEENQLTMIERMTRIETRIAMWAGAGGIIGGAIAVALAKIVLG